MAEKNCSNHDQANKSNPHSIFILDKNESNVNDELQAYRQGADNLSKFPPHRSSDSTLSLDIACFYFLKFKYCNKPYACINRHITHMSEIGLVLLRMKALRSTLFYF